MAQLQVGSTVWIFDSNHRVYAEKKPGEASWGGGPIYREHFVPYKVVSETRASWVLDDGRKVSKKGLQTKGGYGVRTSVYTSLEQVEDDCWVNDKRSAISLGVSRCCDAATLRRIDALLKEAP